MASASDRAAVREDDALHPVVILEAVVAARGVQYPVAYIDHIQKTAKFLVRELDIYHRKAPFVIVF